jgi:hypothetical protein
MEAIASALRMLNIVSSIKRLIHLVISVVQLWNSSYVVLTLKCVYTDVSNQEVFQIPFSQFVLEAKCKALCTQVVEIICE